MRKHRPYAKLTAEDVELIRQLRRDLGYTYRELAGLFNVHISNIGHIVQGKTWTEVR